nr:protein m29.1 [Mastomys natalensis cytomegalovirus 3]WEG69862.1 protein m29.1 [Mastomys natalensis cytomegalovirus 3]WEG70002.1 protein m29.1 [Mastomys natalensis cytomegalovirus 3]WEG70142.1 protein m29.1 [Mastomys natalensis cytomegalovirus 3]WEG70282.1 protein m29.1 [Mastomys natalensis cytomegalovirus 3]
MSKEEMWEKCFDMYVANCGGRFAVKDMKYLVKFLDTLSESEEARFEKEVAAEVHRRYMIFRETKSDSDECSDEEYARIPLTCFDDLEKANDAMNRVLQENAVTRSFGDKCEKRKTKPKM